MRVPVEISAGEGVPFDQVRGLNHSLRAALEKKGFAELYPVQAAAWRVLAGGMSRAHDLCICAPTGSGKTLAYALPIIQGAARTRSLHALIVLPTRELATQVYNVFASLAPAVGLWVGLAAAKVTFATEAAAFDETPPNILVCTPGRLVAHLSAETPSMSLSRLQFLVVDETDRLLRQAYQDWLALVLAALSGPGAGRTVKIMASATLTSDPAKISRLELQAPRYISMSASDHRYKVPKQLREFKVVCAPVDKPIMLMALLQYLSPARAIVFMGSLAGADRLFSFLQGAEGGVALHSSHTAGSRGPQAPGLAAFKAKTARVLVASDAMTRGMDVPGVDVVINYDPAVYPKTYVHRAGRTARAAQSGAVISLLSGEQVRHFKAMLRKVDNTFVKDFQLPDGLVSSLRTSCQDALGRLNGDGQRSPQRPPTA